MRGKTITNLRPPSYVSRETGALELDISVDTWDAMVKLGKLPKPRPTGIAGTTPRWKWSEVESALAGKPVLQPEYEPEHFFRGLVNGKAKERGRGTS